MEIIAKNLVAGDQIAEEDGYLWTVKEIVRQDAITITVLIYSDYSSFENHWSVKRDGTPGGVFKTFNKTDILQGIKA